MDIMLERILSLIPKKPDGKFVHGALKEFANTIGLKSGNLVSDWMNGRSTSYKSYVYEISSKYDVSVEWLQGETDIKKPADQKASGLRGTGYDLLNDENRSVIDSLIEKLLRSQSGE